MSKSIATILATLAIASLMAATPSESAKIVNSGSTNTVGYTISVSSDGKASAIMQNGSSAAKAFTITTDLATRFFSDLAAARKAGTVTVPCMKSASFGSSTHVSWEGWTSPDLTCPPKDSVGEALIKDVEAIRQAAGIPASPLRQH